MREHKLIDPGDILDKTREIVCREFEKSKDDVKDGMDIALCSINGTKLSYAGANNPVWIVKHETHELIEIKADKQPIGKFDRARPFTSHTIECQKGDTVYVFSDGYPDQFGGEKGKKFKLKSLRQLIVSIQNKPMEKQYQLLRENFIKWKGDIEQVDDICIIGVKI